MSDFLAFLADPDIAFILFVIGALGVAVEAVHPNLVTGVLGGFALLLAFLGFGGLPLNLLALALIAFGFVLFVLETQFTSHGLLTVAGIAAVALGASALYTGTPQPASPVTVAPVLILVTVGTVTVLMAGVSYAALRSRRMLAPVGLNDTPVPVGSHGVVQAPLAPAGTVHLAGETWSARTLTGGSLERGAAVRLVRFDGLVALVEPAAPVAGARPLPPAAPLPADRP